MYKHIRLIWAFSALICITMGILSIIWTPSDLVLNERLRMRPGLPPFDWWKDPPDSIRLKVQLFNITNSERFLNGDDLKLKMEETEPVIVRVVSHIENVVFNENGTLSYDISYYSVYDASLNSINVNATVVMPNYAILLLMSRLWKVNYFLKMGINQLVNALKSEAIIKKTIYEILFNNSDSIISLGRAVIPTLLPWKNSSLMPLIYDGKSRRITVFIGTKYGHRNYFLVDNYNGDTHVPGKVNTCKDSVRDTYAGIVFGQFMPKTKSFTLFNPLVCKNDLYSFQDEVYRYGMKAYRFYQFNNSYDRTYPAEEDCYKGEPPLPSGTSDASHCCYSYPATVSFPHFLFGDQILRNSIEGMNPNKSKHWSYIVIEPVTGTTLELKLAIQTNIYVRRLEGFPKEFERFSDMIVPLFHAGLFIQPAHHVLFTLRCILLLPIIGSISTTILFASGLFSLWKAKIKIPTKKKRTCKLYRAQDRKTSEVLVFLNKNRD